MKTEACLLYQEKSVPITASVVGYKRSSLLSSVLSLMLSHPSSWKKLGATLRSCCVERSMWPRTEACQPRDDLGRTVPCHHSQALADTAAPADGSGTAIAAETLSRGSKSGHAQITDPPQL